MAQTRISLSLWLAVTALSQEPNIPSAGCVIHLRASLGITVVGGAVSGWQSQCGDMVTFEQPLTTKRPGYFSPGVAMNGHQFVTFDSSGLQFLGPVNASIPANGDRTFVAVVNVEGGHNNNVILGLPPDYRIGFGKWPDNRQESIRFKNVDDYFTDPYTSPWNADVIVFVTQSNGGTQVNAWVDGTSIYNEANNAFAFDLFNIYLGVPDTNGNDSFKGKVAEVIVYDRVLTNPEFDGLLGELRTYYDTPTNPFDGLPSTGGGGGDPHFSTLTGHRFDYHGECDLVFMSDSSVDNSRGIRIHIRTIREGYFSFIERIAVQIGTDVLEFAGIQDWSVNGKKSPPRPRLQQFAGYAIGIFPRALSVRLNESKKVKLDFFHRRNGFLYLVVDDAHGGGTFRSSLGLLGDGENGRMIARDGLTDLSHDANAFAGEWQVRDWEPQLFHTNREPQYPTKCRPPEKILENRLGMPAMRERAALACQKRRDDVEECIFDVLATRKLTAAAF